ncbi:hypothetical protein H696_06255, partial [Fonticula alba]
RDNAKVSSKGALSVLTLLPTCLECSLIRGTHRKSGHARALGPVARESALGPDVCKSTAGGTIWRMPTRNGRRKGAFSFLVSSDALAKPDRSPLLENQPSAAWYPLPGGRVGDMPPLKGMWQHRMEAPRRWGSLRWPASTLDAPHWLRHRGAAHSCGASMGERGRHC